MFIQVTIALKPGNRFVLLVRKMTEKLPMYNYNDYYCDLRMYNDVRMCNGLIKTDSTAYPV